MELYILAGLPEHRKLWALACFEDHYVKRYSYSLGAAAPKNWEGLKSWVRKHFNAISDNEARARSAGVKQAVSLQVLGEVQQAVVKCAETTTEEDRTKVFAAYQRRGAWPSRMGGADSPAWWTQSAN